MLDLEVNIPMGTGKLARVIRILGLVGAIASVTSNTPPVSSASGCRKIDAS